MRIILFRLYECASTRHAVKGLAVSPPDPFIHPTYCVTADPRVPEDTLEVVRSGEFDLYKVYDTVWTLAAGLAHSISQSNGDFNGKVNGSAAMEYITSGKLSFTGASGLTEFAANGDPTLSSANMTISNVRRKGNLLVHEVVGLISASEDGSSSAESQINITTPIEWPNGLVYPQVRHGMVSYGDREPESAVL